MVGLDASIERNFLGNFFVTPCKKSCPKKKSSQSVANEAENLVKMAAVQAESSARMWNWT